MRIRFALLLTVLIVMVLALPLVAYTPYGLMFQRWGVMGAGRRGRLDQRSHAPIATRSNRSRDRRDRPGCGVVGRPRLVRCFLTAERSMRSSFSPSVEWFSTSCSRKRT